MININKEKEIWDDLWENTPDTVTYKDIFYLMDEIKLEYLLDILPAPEENIKIIEVGCGSARLSCFLASLGYDTTCLDYSENALRVAKKIIR
ncbi:MAG: methyltransferase domain-containing protein [Methanobacteriaceae archaeon]